jgi:hypothetical protein
VHNELDLIVAVLVSAAVAAYFAFAFRHRAIQQAKSRRLGMNFTFTAHTEIPPSQSARLQLEMVNEHFESSELLGMFDLREARTGPAILEFPETAEPVTLRLRAEFRNLDRDKAEATAKIIPTLVAGLHVSQLNPGYIVANILHRFTPERRAHVLRANVADDQCTVACHDGESRSGRNVCIECTTGHGTIKICC